MFSHEPERLKPLMEHIEQPAYFVDLTGKVLFGNTAALIAGPLQMPAADRISMRIPHVSGELVIARSLDPFPLEVLREVTLRLPEGVIICDEAPGRPIVFVNEAMTRISGYAEAELIGRNPKLLQGPRSSADAQELIRRKLDAGESFVADLTNYRKDGSEYVVNLLTFPVRLTGAEITHWVGIHRDITENRRQEQLFFEAQRLEGMGLMAGGIAHDFNNLLAVITGTAMLLESRLAGSPDLHYLRDITAAGSRAAELCRQLMAYSGGATAARQSTDLSDLVEETSRLMKVAISPTATVRKDLASDLPAIEADQTQLRQVIVNMVRNASDALGPRRGEINLRTTVTVLHEPLPGCRLTGEVPAGNWVEFAVSDTGCGMSIAVQQRLFEPFFTTKSNGHGLGMPAVLGIVRKHSGHIVCTSTEGKGTTFRIFLPFVSPVPTDMTTAPFIPPARHGDVALIIDDDDMIRGLLAAILVKEGFETHAAPDGAAGLALFKEHRDHIRVVVIDYSMPKMDGVETVVAMREDRHVPTVLVTAFDESEIRDRMEAWNMGHVEFLRKPFTQSDLRAALARVLRSPPAA